MCQRNLRFMYACSIFKPQTSRLYAGDTYHVGVAVTDASRPADPAQTPAGQCAVSARLAATIGRRN